MSVIKNFIMKIFNGTDWDIYHPETSADMVKYTPSGSGEESDVKVQIDSLNSNLAGLISVEQRGVTLMADWCHIADKSGYYLLAAFNIRGDTNHPVTGIQRSGTGGYTIIISGGTNGTQHGLWLIWGKAT